jgi:hypothetical protein
MRAAACPAARPGHRRARGLVPGGIRLRCALPVSICRDANNFAILDFLLFLECIEAECDVLNMPRFA